MNTITVPKNFMLDDDLVIIPRRQYENLLRAKANDHSGVVIKRDSSFKVPKKYEKFYNQLDKELTASLREIEEGKVSDIFDTAEEAIKFLKSRKVYST